MVLMTGELTVTNCLQFVRKIRQQDPAFRHFLLSVTISLHFYAAYTDNILPNAI